mmetsp:Transcript_12142/g.48898  ORF Transcript_12142/g.48898 Transcript_12142/m.48898 type:complete len:182 (-) Transcript_12142:237-782(-)|eukprot:CAMPEP_0185699340 /NCGR_PEP_ID=MMETSP1164-20130828/6867_1 /TAXON_ID=1104430 /ORGANISM="Chrysoreinhardia sp, Strain CCMP2950" /LENGTH=181 /DNA_ID=CAMNT_0028366275 /DNA_START=35 /DNA_END=580 /DNA_ORIENTATION=-
MSTDAPPADPPTSSKKRDGDAVDDATEAKKPRMNIDHVVGKAFHGKSFHELDDAPIHALQGIADWEDAVGEKLKIKSIKDLGTWKYFHWARALVRLAAEEIEGHRVEGSQLNASKALDKGHEGKALKDILALPPSALRGLPKAADELLGAFHVYTIADLGKWKHAEIASAIATMAKLEKEN